MLDYVLCYAQSFTYGAIFGGAVAWASFVYKYRKNVTVCKTIDF